MSQGWLWGGLERDRARDAHTHVNVHMCECVCWGFHTTRFARTWAEVVPAGWGADGGDLGEGAAMHSRSPPFAAMGVCLCVCRGSPVTTPEIEPVIQFLCFGLPSSLRKVWIGF